MALLAAAKHFFKSRPLVANCCIYGSLYVVSGCWPISCFKSRLKFVCLQGAELSQQTITKKILVRAHVAGEVVVVWVCESLKFPLSSKWVKKDALQR